MNEIIPAQSNKPILSNSEVTKLVTNILFYVYESGKTPKKQDIVESLSVETKYDYDTCSGIIGKMLTQQYLMPVEAMPGDTHSEVAFGTNGLWLLENGFMHGEESIDSMALTEQILKQNRFFD